MVSARQSLNLSQSHSAAPLSILVLEWRCTHDFFLCSVLLLVFQRTIQSQQIKKHSTRSEMAGLFFYLVSDTVQGFLFARIQYSQIQAFTVCFAVSMQLYHPRRKTAHRALQRLFLRLHPLNRQRYQTYKSGYNTICATLDGLPAPGRCTGQHRPSIIIMYIRGAAYRRPCQRRRVSSYRMRIAAKC